MLWESIITSLSKVVKEGLTKNVVKTQKMRKEIMAMGGGGGGGQGEHSRQREQ